MTQRRRERIAIAVVVFIQACLLLALAARLGTWIDEEYALASTGHGVPAAWVRALTVEQQAPLYFVLEAAWRTINRSVFFARIPSVLCALGVTLSASAISRRLWPQANACWLAAAFAFNPFVVYAGLEVRAYALALLISAGLWLAFYDGYFRDDRPRARLWFVVLAIAGTGTQYFVAFTLPGFAVALAVAGRPRELRNYLFACALVTFACAPLLLTAARQAGALFPETAPWPVTALRWLRAPWSDFLFPADFGGSLRGRRVPLARAMALVAFLAILAGRPRPERRVVALIAPALVVELLYVVAGTGLRVALVAPRHFVALFVPLWAAVYGVIASMTSRHRRLLLGVAGALYALASGIALSAQYHSLQKFGAWPQVGAYLQTHARAGDAIVAFPAELIWPLERYETGPARLIGLPRPLPFYRYGADAIAIHSEREVRAVLQPTLKRGRVWLVTYPECGPPPQLGCMYLERVVARDAVLVGRETFGGTLVRELLPRRAARHAGESR